jgi:hypothetical protein
VPDGARAQWEAPRWRSRAFHIHTQHPLELTDVLNGFDIPLWMDRGRDPRAWKAVEEVVEHAGMRVKHPCRIEARGPRGEAGETEYCEHWEDMVEQVVLFFEWCAAHRVNKVEWLLLGSHKWGPVVESSLRHRRLSALARLGQGLGLMIGVDDPIALQQQHSWIMTNTLGPKARQLKKVRERVDWLMSLGLDFLSTESGLSEFTQ